MALSTPQYASPAGTRVLTFWATQRCTLMVLQNAVLYGFIDQAEYQAAIDAHPPVDPDNPNSLSQP